MSGLFAALFVGPAWWVVLLVAGLALAAVAYWLGRRHAVESVEAASERSARGLSLLDPGPPSVEELARPRAVTPPAKPLVAVTPEGGPTRGRLTGVRVLAVDDDRDWRELLTRILAGAGAEAHVAASAAEALRLFDAWHPDVVLSDLAMPGMDGYALSDAIRTRPGRVVPMVAMSAHGSAHERIRTARAGFAAHLTKPVLADELIKTLGRAAAGPVLGAREARRVV